MTVVEDFGAESISRKKAVMRATVIENHYIPHDPTLKQAEFLLLDTKEALYGGAAGGGKVMRF